MLRGFTRKKLLQRFPDDGSVLEAIMRNCSDEDGRLFCQGCKTPQPFKRVEGRKCYRCTNCHHHHYPLAGTVMADTKLPLQDWLVALHLFYTHRSGLSAKELQRELEVTYKVAWRILHQFRSLMGEEEGAALDGTVEVDETYVGGRKQASSRRPTPKKTAVFGVLQRDGRVRATAIEKVDKPTIFTLIREEVAPGTTVNSDEHPLYTRLPKAGYPNRSVLHKKFEWKRGPASTNGIEGYWSQVKRAIRGSHVSVSSQWLQYLDERSFQHNRREHPERIQEDLLARLLRSVPGGVRKESPGLQASPRGRGTK